MERQLTTMSTEDVRSLIQSVYWYHSFEIVPGVVTPGQLKVDARRTLNDCFDLEVSLAGKRVLEIGTWDGPYAFELESRSAEVVATDIQDPDATGFGVSKRILSSHVEYVRTSVYDLETHVCGLFDVVLFLGVFYHLKHPLLALEQIRRVLKPGGRLLFEGECFGHYAETVETTAISSRLLLALLAHSRVPLALSYPGQYKGAKNWFIPNPACLQSWLRSAGFEIVKFETSFPRAELRTRRALRYLLDVIGSLRRLRGSHHQRAWGVARRLDAEPQVEHDLMPKKACPGR